MGDPAGIGPDITLATWIQARARGLPPFIVFGDPAAFEGRARRLGMTVPVSIIATPADGMGIFEQALPVIDTGGTGYAQPGRPSVADRRRRSRHGNQPDHQKRAV
jgi:4-hydroxythreonine-4-phosphate dehydrogenase